MRKYLVAAMLMVCGLAHAQSLTITITATYQNGVDSGTKTFSQTRLLGLPLRLEGVLSATTTWQNVNLTSLTNPTASWLVLKYLSTNQTFVTFSSVSNVPGIVNLGLGNNEPGPGVGGGGSGDPAAFPFHGTNLWYQAVSNSAAVYYAIFSD